jgi:serine/threonine protein phosphatase 1
MKLTYVIGDVHGSKELLDLEKIIDPNNEHEIWLLGDLFTRGCHPHLVWEFLQKENRFTICGNHDKKVKWLIDDKKDITYKKFYQIALDNLSNKGIDLKKVSEYIENLPLIKEFDNHILAHAAINLCDPTTENEYINCFGNYLEQYEATFSDWWNFYSCEKTICYGHENLRESGPRIMKNSIGIDTGCVHGYSLTAYCLETEKFYSVKTKDWFFETKKLY